MAEFIHRDDNKSVSLRWLSELTVAPDFTQRVANHEFNVKRGVKTRLQRSDLTVPSPVGVSLIALPSQPSRTRMSDFDEENLNFDNLI